MKVGDLIRLSDGWGDQTLRGTILKVFVDPFGEPDDLKASVFWTDGDHTEEFCMDLEVVS